MNGAQAPAPFPLIFSQGHSRPDETDDNEGYALRPSNFRAQRHNARWPRAHTPNRLGRNDKKGEAEARWLPCRILKVRREQSSLPSLLSFHSLTLAHPLRRVRRSVETRRAARPASSATAHASHSTPNRICPACYPEPRCSIETPRAAGASSDCAGRRCQWLCARP